ncbi:MAG: FliM/FliN family flagellar motor switch protein [Candidatus Riflebacteria bacterium]|nr:FliM/FliN family flagellar motor switch protein [Candidatus Riflebacteria bacterium]
MLETYLLPGVMAWSVLFGRRVELATPELSRISSAVLDAMGPSVIAGVEFSHGLKGRGHFVVGLDVARVLVGLALGAEVPPTEFDSIHRSSFSSIFKYLLAEMRSLIVRKTGRKCGTSEPDVRICPVETQVERARFVQARLPWTVAGKTQEPLLFWLELGLAQSLLSLRELHPRPLAAVPRAAAGAQDAGRRASAPTATPFPEDARSATEVRESVASDPARRPLPMVARMKRLDREPADGPDLPSAGPRSRQASVVGPAQVATPDEPDGQVGSAAALPGRSDPMAPGPEAWRTVEAFRAPPAPRARPAAPGHRAADGRQDTRPAFPDPQDEEPCDPELPSPLDADGRELRIELGRAWIVSPLKLGQVVPLDRLAGESVDVYAGGHLIARGEVAVSGEVLAVRVTQVVAGRGRSRSASEPNSGGRGV